MTEEDGTKLGGRKQVPLVPVAEGSRIAALDLIRGVAIFGILLVNIQAFAFPPCALNSPGDLEPVLGAMTAADRVAFWGTEIFCEMKFVTIFSLLFGVSIGMLARKGLESGTDPEPILIVRFAVLLAIGLLHALLLWFGDILFHYALLGFLVVATFRLPPRLVWLLACGSFLVPLLLVMLVSAAEDGSSAPPGVTSDPVVEVQAELETYGQGSIAQILSKNVETWFGMVKVTMVLFGPRTISCFWLGLLAVQLGAVHEAKRRRALLVGLATFALAPGLFIEGVRAWYESHTDLSEIREFTQCFPIQYVGSFLVALGYIGVLGSWAGSAFLRPVQVGISAVGRLALSCYLSHTVICLLIFYSYGLGLFGSIPRWSLPLIAAGIVVVQMVVCVQWLARFHFGPMEWLWRSLTYRRRQPFRRGA